MSNETGHYDKQLRAWAGRQTYVRRLWRFTSSNRAPEIPADLIDLAVDIDPTRALDRDSLTSWIGDAHEIKMSIFNATNCEFRIGLYHPANQAMVRDVDTTGILLFSREGSDTPVSPKP